MKMEENMKKTLAAFLFFVLIVLTCNGYAAKLADLPNIMKPTSLQVVGNDFFVTEGPTFFVFSLKDFKQKGKFGAEGQGPGEFNMEIQLKIMPDFYLADSPFKFALFKKDGTLIKEHRITAAREVIPFKDKYILVRERVDQQNKKVFRAVFLVNSEFMTIKELYVADFDANVRSFEEKPNILLHYFGVQCYDDKIFVADSKKGLFINVFDSDGNQVYTIDKKIEKLKTSEEFKNKVIDEFKISNRNVYESFKSTGYNFHEYLPPIRYFYVNDDHIYVVTYKEKDNKHELIIMDLKGKTIKNTYVPLQSFGIRKSISDFVLYTFNKGKIYELVENVDSETWELHCTKIE
jgi:hypothetical protein